MPTPDIRRALPGAYGFRPARLPLALLVALLVALSALPAARAPRRVEISFSLAEAFPAADPLAGGACRCNACG